MEALANGKTYMSAYQARARLLIGIDQRLLMRVFMWKQHQQHSELTVSDCQRILQMFDGVHYELIDWADRYGRIPVFTVVVPQVLRTLRELYCKRQEILSKMHVLMNKSNG